MYKSSRQRCSIKKGIRKNFTKFVGKHSCKRLFLNKIADLNLWTTASKCYKSCS